MENYEKLYREALERAKVEQETFFNLGNISAKTAIEKIFPELRESEDERIRKEIVDYLRKFISHHDCDLVAKSKVWIAWLEKQGEQKPEINDNILLRFAFYQYDDDTLYLSSVFVEECNRKHGYGAKILKAAEEVAKTFGISKIRLKVETNSWMEKWYKRNGYEYLTSEGKYDWLEKQGEQKPAWSEEDNLHLANAILAAEKEWGIESCTSKWLKSLKERVQPQQKEWSEEDSNRLARIHKFIWANRKGDTNEIYQLEQDADWLMTLKPQTKQEWSEEDESILNGIMNYLCSHDSCKLEGFGKWYDWLKSIKPNH